MSETLIATFVRIPFIFKSLHELLFLDGPFFRGKVNPENQRHNEIQACNIAYCLRLGPNCVASDKDALLMIMPFVEGHALSSKDLNGASLSCRLGEMIHTLHAYSESYPTRYTLLERLKIHYQKGKNSGIAYPTGFDQSVATVLNKPSDASSVPCHGDLNPSNVLIRNDEIFIIDWANATWDDPFVDLSYISLLTNMTDEQERVFLKAYFGREATSHELERLKEGQSKIYLITAAIWLRYSESLEDQQLTYHERVVKLDAQLNDPSLKNAREYLREGKVVDLRSDSKEAIKAYALSFYKAYLLVTHRCLHNNFKQASKPINLASTSRFFPHRYKNTALH